MAVLGVFKGKIKRTSPRGAKELAKEHAKDHLNKYSKDSEYFRKKDESGNTLFHRLCKENEFYTIKELLKEKDFEISGFIYGDKKNTILHYAAPFPELYQFLSEHHTFRTLLIAKNESDMLPGELALKLSRLTVDLSQRISGSPRSESTGSAHESPKSSADALSALFKNLSLTPKTPVSEQFISEEWHRLLDIYHDYSQNDQIEFDRTHLANADMSYIVEFLEKGGSPQKNAALKFAFSMANSRLHEENYLQKFLMLLYFSSDDFKLEKLQPKHIALSLETFDRILLARSLRYKRNVDEIHKRFSSLINAEYEKKKCPSPTDFKDPIDSMLVKVCVSDDISFEEKMHMLHGIALRVSLKDVFSRLKSLAGHFDIGTKYRIGYVGCMFLMTDFRSNQIKMLMLGKPSRLDVFIEAVGEKKESKEIFKELCEIKKNYAQVVRRARVLRDKLKESTQLAEDSFPDLFDKALNKEKNDDLVRAIARSIKEMTFEFYRNVALDDFVNPEKSKVIQEFQENRNKLISFFSSEVLVKKDHKTASKVLGLLVRIQQALIVEEPGYPRDFSGFDLMKGLFNKFEVSRLKHAFEALDKKSKSIFDETQRFMRMSPTEYAERIPELNNYHESTLHHGDFLTQLNRYQDAVGIREDGDWFDPEALKITGKVASDVARVVRNATLATYARTSDLEGFLKRYAPISEVILRKQSYGLEHPVVNLDKIDISNFDDFLAYLKDEILPVFRNNGEVIEVKDATQTLLNIYEKKFQEKLNSSDFKIETGQRLLGSFFELLDVFKGVLFRHNCKVESTISSGRDRLHAILDTSIAPKVLIPQFNETKRSASVRRQRRKSMKLKDDDIISLSSSSSGSLR